MSEPAESGGNDAGELFIGVSPFFLTKAALDHSPALTSQLAGNRLNITGSHHFDLPARLTESAALFAAIHAVSSDMGQRRPRRTRTGCGSNPSLRIRQNVLRLTLSFRATSFDVSHSCECMLRLSNMPYWTR